jgi:energy-coupling factor transport system ATP-binding protein
VPPLLEAERLSYWYPGIGEAQETSERPALTDVSLAFGPGELVLVLGPSGSGKSTLIQALLGVVPALTGGAVGGRVLLEGVPVLERGLAGVAGTAGLVLQDPESQLTNLDVEGEVVFGPENLGLPLDEIGRRLDESLAATGIAYLRDRFVYALSGGQKQRVAIAAGLAMRPRVLLLDSPTSNLDPLGSAQTLEAIVRLWQESRVELIVMAAHRVDDLLPYATRVVVLDGGSVRFDGTPDDVFGEHLLTLRDELGIFVPEVCEVAVAARGSGGKVPRTVADAVELLGEALTPHPLRSATIGCATGTGPRGRAALRADIPLPAAGEGEITRTAMPAPLSRAQGEGLGVRASPVPAVEVSDVHFAYATGRPVLQGVSLKIGRGELLALLGQNGTGKTTLAKNIAGLYRPSRGRIILGGVDVTASTDHLRTGKVGYVFQYPDHQFVALTVADELAYGPRARGVPEAEVQARVEGMLARFRLEAARAVAPYSLSMGEKRRLSVATMLILEPDVLILDEPTTGQDRHNTVALMEILHQEARARGMTVIQITHDMEQVAAYADRVVVMDGGAVVFDGDARGLFGDDALLTRCHLTPTPTFSIARQLWPTLDRLPITPTDLGEMFAPATASARSHAGEGP